MAFDEMKLPRAVLRGENLSLRARMSRIFRDPEHHHPATGRRAPDLSRYEPDDLIKPTGKDLTNLRGKDLTESYEARLRF